MKNKQIKSAEQYPAVFLDRDGTLIEDVGVISSADQIILFPDTIEALKKLQEKYLLFVISNQSGVSKGDVTRHEVDKVNQHLENMLENEGVYIEKWYVCPHQRSENCDCIKPKPEFILQAEKEFNLDLEHSFVIGDHPHDALTGNEHGVFGLYLLTGHGSKHLPDLSMDKLIFHRLINVTQWILDHPDHEASLEKQIAEGADLIRNGGVCAFPTETVYGLGADVFQPDAIEQIFAIKGRPHYNPLIAHISDPKQLDQLVTHVPETAQKLIDAFWPGPLTIVLPKRKEVPDIVTGGHDTVAVRMPAHPIAHELIKLCQTPVAAPSANKFTCTSPTTAQHVREQLGDKCELIVDGGACRVGVESTVITLAGPVPVILRHGGIPAEDIEMVLGKVEIKTTSDKKEDAESPGMMPNHYAPATKLSAFDDIPETYDNQKDIGVMLFKPSERTFAGVVEVLSKSGDTKEAAANFFAALRRLDDLNLREIVAEYAPYYELGNAINNRLSKAANGRSEV